MLVDHPSFWQAHLERISDFLLVGKGIWWNECENGDIQFFDAKGNPESLEAGPLLHHFRSSSFKSEESFLKKCWLKCLEQKSDLPLLRLQIEDENGNLVVHHTNIESDDHMMPSAEVIGDAPLPGDEVVNQHMVNDVVGDDGGNVCDVTARNDLGSLCEVVDSNVVADECNDVVDDADLQGEVRGR